MEYRTKVGRSGNSLCCRISKGLSDQLGLAVGTEVLVSSVPGGFGVKPVTPKIIYSIPFTEVELISMVTAKKSHAHLLR